MYVRMLRVVLATACAFGLKAAWADIYTWTDASGTLNVSNVAPPEGAKVTKVMHESPPRPAPVVDPAAEASRQAEVQALAARVRQLEYEAEFARRQPPPLDYGAMGPPPPMQYPLPMQYAVESPQPAMNECNPAWAGCGYGWNVPFYPAVVIVARPQGFRRPPQFHGGHRFPMQMPVRAPGAVRTR